MPGGAPETTPHALQRAAREFGDAEAVADHDTRLSWAELLDQVRLAARFLHARGVAPGDRVALWAPNTYHWPIAALGIHYAGATLVPINTRYTAHEALDILQRARASALFVVGPFLGADRLEQLTAIRTDADLPHLHTIVQLDLDRPFAEMPVGADTVGELANTVAVDIVEARADAVSPDDVSDILFTSGTTGRSKGVMSAHRQALGVARAWADCGLVTADDRYLVINPFFHSFGYKAGVLACLLTGATIVPQAVFDVDVAMRTVAAERITVLPGPPTIYQTILDSPERASLDLSSLRLAVTGAATVPVALVERMQTELSFRIVLTAYGLTEAVVVTMCRPEDAAETIATTSGRATADFEIRIGANSEILLRGPNVMLGYLDDPEATAEAIEPDGWLHTGDVGELDDHGYLRITDRLKDMYICGGYNVYPAEVEQALARLDGVAESVVIGVPDERLGEVGKAFVIRRPGATLTEGDVIAFAKERIANFKVPRFVAFRDDLPRNATGKPLKRVLRDEEKPHG